MTCMYDRDEQCFEDCIGCPRAINTDYEADYADLIGDEMREQAGCRYAEKE